MKILLVLPDGVGLRNFVFSRFRELVVSEGELIIWHGLSDETISKLKLVDDRIRWKSFPAHHEGLLAFILRRAKLLAQLFRQEESGTNVILKSIKILENDKIKTSINIFIYAIARIFSLNKTGVLFLENMHQLALKNNSKIIEFITFIRSINPDVVFCSHQRSEMATLPIAAARIVGKPTVTFIYSWDNLPKGRMAVKVDHYFVWSNHMFKELKKYYLDIKDNQIHIVGTPQFEHYFDKSMILDRCEFLFKLGIAEGRKVILFSGDDYTTSPFDPIYLQNVAQALLYFPVDERPALIFRRSPTDLSGRYKPVLEQYLDIIDLPPLWDTFENNDWTKVVPLAEDTRLLTNCVVHSDLVINIGSTMALDFAINNKPALYLRYSIDNQVPELDWHIENVYNFPHFNHFNDFTPVHFCYSQNALAENIKTILDNPKANYENWLRWINLLVQTPIDKASENIYTRLLTIFRSN